MRFCRIALLYVGYSLRKVLRRTSHETDLTADTWWGRMYVANDPSITPYLTKNGVYDAALSVAFGLSLGKNSTVMDIGANTGYFCLEAARFTHGTIIAFEPDPSNFRLLQKNMQPYGDRFQGYAYAVGDEKKDVTFWIDTQAGGNNSLSKQNTNKNDVQELHVPMIRIDDFIQDHPCQPDILLMDVQGAEVMALRGMKKMLTEHPPTILFIEIWPFGIQNLGSDTNEIRTILHEAGYRLSHLQRRSRLPDPETQWEELIAHCLTVKHGKGFCNLVATRQATR